MLRRRVRGHGQTMRSQERRRSQLENAVVAVFCRRWLRIRSVSLLVLLLSGGQPVFAWQSQDEPAEASVIPVSSPSNRTAPETSLELELQILEAQARRVLENDLDSGELRSEVLREVEQVRDSEQKSILLKRLTRLFSSEADSTAAREAALAIDQTDLLSRVRGMVILADAEQTRNNTKAAWWSLREAQQLALRLDKPEDVVAAFREIGTVERKIRSRDRSKKSQLDPSPDTIISKVLDHGLPPRGYREIDFLREGGGPLREPVVIRHTYYYDGDRYFQGPHFAGGDTLVRVTHPRTGCEVTVAVKMPAGAPIVVHDRNEIEYLFPEVTLELSFQKAGGHRVDYDRRDWKYTLLRRRLEKHAATGSVLSGAGAGAISGVREAARIGLSGPVSIGRRLPILSNLLEQSTPRIPGTLSVPSP